MALSNDLDKEKADASGRLHIGGALRLGTTLRLRPRRLGRRYFSIIVNERQPGSWRKNTSSYRSVLRGIQHVIWFPQTSSPAETE